MKKIALGILLLSPLTVNAACIGTDSFKTCTDSYGNSYNVSKFGNTTNVNGYNPSTGSSWSQSTNRMGNSSFTNGTSSDGSSWNSTTQSINGTSYTHGTDSKGNSFSQTCNAYGCY